MVVPQIFALLHVSDSTVLHIQHIHIPFGTCLNYFHKLRPMQAIERLQSINGLLHIEALADFVANSIGGMFIEFMRWIRRFLQILYQLV